MSGKDRTPDAAELGRILYQEMDRKLQDLLSPENISTAQRHIEGAWQSLGELAQLGKDGVKSAVDLISELIRDLTGVVSFSIVPELPSKIGVDIRLKAENELPYKQPVAPFVDVEAVCIGKRIRFEGLINKDGEGKGKKEKNALEKTLDMNGLRCDIHEGFSLRFNTPLGKPVVPIRGSVVLKRDDKKELVMETSTTVPGTDFPVNITIPLKKLLGLKKKSW